ncbi:MAG: phosphate ABC transporter substrate-binding protein PstS [Actinobacteria bacterium]|nr:phosphate ABC transporter substrate-binding protein PstS [Actinomycetota bacterium]
MRLRAPATLIVGLLLLGAGLVAGCGGDVRTGSDVTGTSQPADGLLSTRLDGAGATFPEPLYLEWIGEFVTTIEPGVTMNYQGIGSGGGIQQFTQMTVDFGATDAPMKDEEIATAEEVSGAKVLHIPTVLGAVAVAYNVEGIDKGLKLDQETLAGIFLGDVTAWNDPAIVALNPDLVLPDEGINVVHRSDSSGTTAIFTGYLAKVSPVWADSAGFGKEVQWPVGVGGQGNDGVAAVIQQQAGSIGYVELSYATEGGLSTVALRNASGVFVEPTVQSTSAAGAGIDYPEDLRFSLSDSPASGAYPIVGATWILAYDSMVDPAREEALRAFLTWALQEGGVLAEELLYAPLPEDLRALALAKADQIGAAK